MKIYGWAPDFRIPVSNEFKIFSYVRVKKFPENGLPYKKPGFIISIYYYYII